MLALVGSLRKETGTVLLVFSLRVLGLLFTIKLVAFGRYEGT
jgi:hypothetical protein